MRKVQPQRASPRKRQMSPSRTWSPMSAVSSSTRSPSPLGRQRTPAPYRTTGRGCQGDTAEGNETGIASEDPAALGDNCISPGVRYITEPLIKKLSKQENLMRVTALNLCLAKDGGKKFKYIENLEKCDKLEVLNLSCNLVEKIEKLDKLLKLCDLNLSFNRISKIEGIEHLHNLQKLNLAGNQIEHIPVWVGKKLRSLRTLNLRKNKIASLQEVAKLKPLKDLTSLFLGDNPVANLPHYRLYTIFHLRSLEDLDGQQVTNRDREEAHERFNLEEVENLEKDLERTAKEAEDLRNKQSRLLEQLQQQEDENKSLKQKIQQQKQNCKELESSLETKNELLKQKTVELTRACQKQYELEQELAFYKIDAKFEPLGYYYPAEDVELDGVPGESPYIGKARYKRNTYAVESYVPDEALKIQTGNVEQEEQPNIQQLKRNLLRSLDEQLQEKQRKIKEAQEKLADLQEEVANTERRVLKAAEELKQVQDAVGQKKMAEVEKDGLRQQLSRKILLLNQLREEALELEKQLGRQRREIARKEKEVEGLQSFLDTLDPKDPRHAHMKAQKAAKEQQLDIMNQHYKELEGRLDEILSRIAKETEEIQDLEQQLTDGQIAANEALKKDLEAIIAGLQEYLESIKGQAKLASEECRELRKDKEGLLQRLEELEGERNQLEIVAMDAENLQKEVADLEQALEEQRELNEALQEAQGDLSAYEAELKARDIEVTKLKEELERLKHRSQLEYSALQAELSKERQALENALTKTQLLEWQEEENHQLLSQVKQLKKDNCLLKQQLDDAQHELEHATDGLLHPEDVLARLNELQRKLQTGEEIRSPNPQDVLGKSLAGLHQRFAEILAHSRQENEAAQAREKELQKEMASQKAELEEAQEKYWLACDRAAEAKIKSEKRQNKARVQQMEDEIRHLGEKLKSMEEIQGLTDQQLQEAEEEKERILAQLQDLENRKNVEEAKAQMQFLGIEKELRELKKVISASDKQATAELWAAKDQLRALHGTVCRIHQERSEELQELEKFGTQATRATKDLALAEAEIELLQQLLKEKEEQHERDKNDSETAASCFRIEEIAKLKQLLKSQRADIDRLRGILERAGAGGRDDVGAILDGIAALKHAVSHQSEAIASIMDPLRPRGPLCSIPSPSQASTPASQSTKDSGVGLQCPTSTPISKGREEGKLRKKEHPICPFARGCPLHPPVGSGPQDPLSGGRNQEDGDAAPQGGSSFLPPPGSVIYTVLPDGTPAPQGTVVYGPPPPSVAANGGPTTVVYGPPPAGTQLLYTPLPANCSVPLVPVAVLHCNIPEHHHLENEILRLEARIDQLKSQRREGQSARASPRDQSDETEERHPGVRDLVFEKKELERQVAELRRVAQRRNRRKDFIDGRSNGLLSELELEKSLQHHDNVVDEIECMEKTLLKRRAELREADRLLAEAELELETTRGKTKDTIQKYNTAKRHLSQRADEAEELERRAQEMAVRLVKADQQLRLLQTNARDLEQHKVKQEEILKEIARVISAKDSEFQSLSQKTEILTEILQKLQANIQVAEGNEDHHLRILKEAEHLLRSKKTDLERLKDQSAAQQQEVLSLDRKLGQKKEELHLLQDSLAQKNADLAQALRDGEAEVSKKRRQIKEMTSFLEELSVQKGELSAQLSEKRAQLSLVTQDIHKEEERLQDILGLVAKHKTELKHVLEMVELESNELEGVKLQHNQKVDELEKMQMAILEEKVQLETLQRASQQQRGEMEHQKQLLEKTQQEAEQLTPQLCLLQKRVQELSAEKEQLEENCAGLEEKLSQTKRTLASTEGSSKAALASFEKMDLDVRELQLDIDQLQKHRRSLNGDLENLQKHFQEKQEELNVLKMELNESRHHLQLLEQDVENATKRKEELLREETALKDSVSEWRRKGHECKESERKKEIQLENLCKEIEDRKQERAKQETVLQHLREETQQEKNKADECLTKLMDQKQQLEEEQAQQRRQLEEGIAKVQQVDERLRKLQEVESWHLTLEDTIRKTRCQLSEKERQLQEKAGEVASLQRELERSRAQEGLLRAQIQEERERAEKHIASLKEAIQTQRAQLEKSLQQQKQENQCLQKEMVSLEQVAQDNHERAKRLMRDLGQIQEEYMQLKSQMKNQADLEKRQKEMKGAVKILKLEVKDKIRTGLKDLSQSPPETSEDLEAGFEANGKPQRAPESRKENYPFTEHEARMPGLDDKLDLAKVHIMDEQWRGRARREQLEHQEDRLKARLQLCMLKQAEVLIKGKQQTEGTLHSLKRQVDALDELVSSTSTDSPFLSLNSSGLTDTSLHEEPNRARNQFARSPAGTTPGILPPSQIMHQSKA
ncbi:centriolin isoform X2 [Pogona vitticeps]